MKTAILAVLMFLLMIFPHELGHFIAARKFDVKVNEFAFGMGPVIWKKQKGETLYSVRLFPVGGFCAMEGEDGQNDEEEGNAAETEEKEPDDPRAFNNKKPWQKIIILAAGSFMNVLTAFIVLTIMVTVLGFSTTTIGSVTAGSPADMAGLEVGDKIVSIDDNAVEQWSDVGKYIQEAEGETVTFGVLRDGSEQKLDVTPQYVENEKRYVIGITYKGSHNIIRGIGQGFVQTGNMFGIMVDSLKMLFSGQAGIQDLSGPVGIVQMVGETSSIGWWYYMFLLALICVNLAVITMFPFPALDGGRIIFVLYGWITGKPVSSRVEGIVHAIGIVILLALAAVVTIG
ncbi:MAG: RIP metalloprotease RseP, partial [Firmicutes bacterium]|nr:RIP metalloprotease RseP [Bacillota bacterium]